MWGTKFPLVLKMIRGMIALRLFIYESIAVDCETSKTKLINIIKVNARESLRQ